MSKKNKDQHLSPEILLVKVKNDGLEITWNDPVVEAGGKNVMNQVTKTFRHEPHLDLVDLLKRLAPHLAFLTEYETDAIIDGFESLSDAQMTEIEERYTTRGIRFKSNNGTTEIHLNGYRKLKRRGGVSNVLANKVRFQSEGESYPYADHLEELADELRTELVEFMGGKRAPDGQITLGFAKAEKAAKNPAEEEEEGGGGGDDDEDGEERDGE